MRASSPRSLLALALAAAVARSVEAAPFSTCAEVKACYVSGGSQTCDVTLERCPPCIYPNAEKYNCWEYDPEVRTTVQCPFVSQKSNYVDCSTADNWSKWATTTAPTTNSTSSVSTTTTTKAPTASNSTTPSPGAASKTSTTGKTTSSSSSNIIMFAGIGVGVLVVLIVLIVLCRRRKRQKDQHNAQMMHAAGPDKRNRAKTKTMHDEAYGAPYNNVLDTSKGAYGSYQHEALSIDGMLGEEPVTPVVLGGYNDDHHNDNHNNYHHHQQQIHKPGKSVGKKNAFPSNDHMSQDISERCTTSANVFDEYLRMKQEMNYDNEDTMSEIMSEMSDYDSETMSMARFSLESSQGPDAGLSRHNGGGLSITDSEYDEHIGNRGASECYSEMSYNDEKYSFSEDDDAASEFARSKPRVPDREVEI